MLGTTCRPFRRFFLLAAILSTYACGRVEEPPRPRPEGSEIVNGGQVPGGATPTPDTPRPPRRSAWVVFGPDTVVAEVARTQEEMERGLMYRNDLPSGAGMLFVWNREEVRSLWMSNTYVDLDVAFLDTSLRVVDIQQMEAESTNIHTSRAPAMFGLEVPAGWFAEHGIGVGDTADLVLGPL